MRLKTYFCPSMDVALRQIRHELGENAIIISTLNEGEHIRVTAACDENELHLSHPREHSEKRQSIDQIKNNICDVMTYHGLSHCDIKDIMHHFFELPRSTIEQGMAAVFDQLFKIEGFNLSTRVAQPKQMMFTGPVGAGKTVTLTKLALELLLCQKTPRLISCDVMKAGALEQLQVYANALQIEFKVCSSPEELEKTVTFYQKAFPEDILLIDTPGINPFIKEEIHGLTDYVLATKLAPILVLPAGGDANETKEQAVAFKDLGCTKFIATRMDAARRYGGIMSVLFCERLDLYALSAGPEIGQRLYSAHADLFVKFVTECLEDESKQTQGRIHDFQGICRSKEEDQAKEDLYLSRSVTSSTTEKLPDWLIKTMERRA